MTNYLAEYDSAAESEKFQLVRRWIDTEPLPFFKQLRAERPVLVTPECTLVARYADVTDILSQPKVFTVALYVPKQSNGRYLMSHDDDPLHSREKAIMQGMLNRDDLPKVRALVTALCNEILDAQKDKRIEAAYHYCRSVPAGLVQNYFGLTGMTREKLIEWSYWAQYDTFHNQPFDARTDAERKHIIDSHNKADSELSKYIVELVAHRLLVAKLSAPFHFLAVLLRKLLGKNDSLSDDIVARMLRTSFPGEVDFNIERLGVNAAGLLIGAVETTARAVAQVVQYLIERPEWFARAKEAARLPDCARFDGIVWEALRYVSPFPYTFRECAEEYTVGRGTDYATVVRPGTYVLALTQSGMFDVAAFENPDDFLPTRNWYHYFHFGFGSHECLGKYVGMVMIPEMIRQLFLRPDLKANERIDYRGGPFPEHYELSWG
ncbi:MAG TPA: cytochrome P450 [Polyangiaceae bacterium]|nr:cytochrome P450 [Polyangiaceae bacterium]